MSTPNTTTTNFDLYQTASAAALQGLTLDALGVESLKLESFTAAGHDRADYVQWQGYFTQNLNNFVNMKKQPSPAAAAAINAAKATDLAAAKAQAIADAANKTQVAAATPTVAA